MKDQSLTSEQPKTIAFQGFAGAYSDLACREAFPEYSAKDLKLFIFFDLINLLFFKISLII